MMAQKKRINDCDICEIASHANCITCAVTEEEELLGNGFDETAELEEDEE